MGCVRLTSRARSASSAATIGPAPPTPVLVGRLGRTLQSYCPNRKRPSSICSGISSVSPKLTHIFRESENALLVGQSKADLPA